MNKKKIIYGSICILTMGVCLFSFFRKQSAGEWEVTVSEAAAAITETGMRTQAEWVKITDVLECGKNETAAKMLDAPERDEDDVDYVLYLEDAGVRDNPVFAAFIDKEIQARDTESGELRYIYQCFREAYVWHDQKIPPVSALHYMAEDLDGDGEKELLAFIQWPSTDGELLVFHEEDGELYQWETWEDFFWQRMIETAYYGNGIFWQGGGAGERLGRYNADGKIEYMIDYGTWWEQEEGVQIQKNSLVVYKDGIENQRLVWEGAPYWYDDSWEETAPEHLAVRDECIAIMNQIGEELGEGRRIARLEWNEDAERVPLDELFDQEEGRAPDGIFYWGAEAYFYLLEGEWVVAEYAGCARDFQSGDAGEDGGPGRTKKYTDIVIENHLGNTFCIERDNLVYFGPDEDLSFIMGDNGVLFVLMGWIPGEFITKPPYVGLSVRLADQEEAYLFMIDAEGMVLIEIEDHFFRMEKK